MRNAVAGWIVVLAVGLSATLLGILSGHATGISDGPPPVHKQQCPDTLVVVTASSADEWRAACSAARQAVDLVGRCSIFLRRSLRVHLLPHVRHPFGGPILGFFDAKRETVFVTQPASVPALINGTPYAELPPAAFYSSVIVHEVVHGILHQNLARPATSHAAYEYPAYALQIESLPQDVRERFLSTFEPQESERPPLFSDSILFFDPYFFAARAYEHFNGSEEGCDNLHGLMQGEVDFIIAR
jgi:hypothetical protein